MRSLQIENSQEIVDSGLNIQGSIWVIDVKVEARREERGGKNSGTPPPPPPHTHKPDIAFSIDQPRILHFGGLWFVVCGLWFVVWGCIVLICPYGGITTVCSLPAFYFTVGQALAHTPPSGCHGPLRFWLVLSFSFWKLEGAGGPYFGSARSYASSLT